METEPKTLSKIYVYNSEGNPLPTEKSLRELTQDKTPFIEVREVPGSKKVVVFMGGHEAQVSSQILRPSKESTATSKQDVLLVDQFVSDGLTTVTISYPEKVDDQQIGSLFKALQEITDELSVKNNAETIVFAGHSFGGSLIQYAVEYGFLKLNVSLDKEKPSTIAIFLSSPRSTKDMIGIAGVIVKNPFVRFLFPYIQKFMIGDKADYDIPSHRNRLNWLKDLNLKKTNPEGTARFHDPKDFYVKPPEDASQYVTYDKAGIPVDYVEFTGTRHNYAVYMNLLINKAGSILQEQKNN